MSFQSHLLFKMGGEFTNENALKKKIKIQNEKSSTMGSPVNWIVCETIRPLISKCSIKKLPVLLLATRGGPSDPKSC